jgi:hypothetical protein
VGFDRYKSLQDAAVLSFQEVGYMDRIKEEPFMRVCLSAGEEGILKTFGERQMVVSVCFLDGASEADNGWLAEQAKMIYEQYYSRVSAHRQKED